jgi:hypothetical protein
MKKTALAAVFFLGIGFISVSLHGQTSTQTETAALPANQFDTSGFPQWGKDLRRAEIIAFGTFPFTMFTATFFMDTWRASNNKWDGRYMPWPFKTAGAIEMSSQERETVMVMAAAGSVVLALTDFIIVQIKRHRTRQRALRLPEGSPIIIKRPPAGDGSEETETEAEALEEPETPEKTPVPAEP